MTPVSTKPGELHQDKRNDSDVAGAQQMISEVRINASGNNGEVTLSNLVTIFAFFVR